MKVRNLSTRRSQFCNFVSVNLHSVTLQLFLVLSSILTVTIKDYCLHTMCHTHIHSVISHRGEAWGGSMSLRQQPVVLFRSTPESNVIYYLLCWHVWNTLPASMFRNVSTVVISGPASKVLILAKTIHAFCWLFLVIKEWLCLIQYSNELPLFRLHIDRKTWQLWNNCHAISMKMGLK